MCSFTFRCLNNQPKGSIKWILTTSIQADSPFLPALTHLATWTKLPWLLKRVTWVCQESPTKQERTGRLVCDCKSGERRQLGWRFNCPPSWPREKTARIQMSSCNLLVSPVSFGGNAATGRLSPLKQQQQSSKQERERERKRENNWLLIISSAKAPDNILYYTRAR